ncbi:hypothetical protein B0H13DRAFT_2122996, partial [Mycena leptocephala]
MHTIDLRKRLAELDAQIAEQKCVLHELSRELYTTAKFPVLTLPAELTAEIFGHCLPPSSNMGWYRSIDSVCRTWRDIALTTPKLWATLDVPFDILPPHLASTAASGEDFIGRWLARAGQVPLSFHDVEQPRMRDLIHRYSNRLQYLELYTTEPQIRFLELDSSVALNWDVPGDSPPLVHVFSKAPRLHELGRSIPTLTKYDGPIHNMDLFTEAQNLTELTCFLSNFLEEDDEFTAITHSGLRSLTIKSDYDFITPYLTLPALQHLSPFLVRSSPPLVSLYWRQCMARVGGTVETLELRSPSTTAIIVAPSSFPNLRSLSLHEHYFSLVQFLYVQSHLRTFRLVIKLYAGRGTFHTLNTIGSMNNYVVMNR